MCFLTAHSLSWHYVPDTFHVLENEDCLAEANKTLQPRATAVSDVVTAYKAAYIPKGRTLAENINQPSKLYSQMVWLHNMMELSEGPANQPMLDQFAEIKKKMVAADARYDKDIKVAMASFNQAAK